MPRASWIRYNEPEAHLDDFVERVLEALTPRKADDLAALGLGPFEEPLLRRLAGRGVKTSAPELLAAVRGDGGVGDTCFPYLETWQARLEPQIVSALAKTFGRSDIVSSRYLLEHCHNPIPALRAIGALLKPDGVLVLEIPDSSKFLAAGDYCFPWEEHVSYFVEETFATIAEQAGFEVVAIFRYPGRLEDALVGLFRVARTASGGRTDPSRRVPKDQFSSYRTRLPATRAFLQNRLANFAGRERDGVAIFGLGHQAIMFVNALGLGSSIGAAADDDPNKHGLFPPGLGMPIISSLDLMENTRLNACLLAVSPASEQKVREKLAPLHARGVHFHSIYADAPGSILDGRQL